MGVTINSESAKTEPELVRAKENVKLRHGGSSYRQASGTNPPIKALSLRLDPPSCNERGNHSYKP